MVIHLQTLHVDQFGNQEITAGWRYLRRSTWQAVVIYWYLHPIQTDGLLFHLDKPASIL